MENKFAIAVKCLLKNEDDKYLILKKTQEENKKDTSSNLYDIPGGRIEYGENVVDALIREIYEETGINITLNNIQKILDATSVVRKDGLHLVIITYLVNIKNTNIKISSEHSSFYWADKSFKNLPDWIKDKINLV